MEVDLDQILQLSPQENATFEKEQNLFSLIKTMEYLEWAYMSGKIQGKQYDVKFRQLLNNFNICKDSIQNFEGLDSFI